MKNLTRKVIALVSVLVGVSLPHSVFAGSYPVYSNADTDQNNVGTLRWAIHQANQDTDTTIRIDFNLPGGFETITLNSNLLPIQIATDVARTFTMDGLNTPGLIIDGNGNSIFFVDSGQNVQISRMTLQNGTSTGGNGGVGGSDTEGGGGGGGLGAGGALFVNAAATVTVTDIQFDTNTAIGGDGGASNGAGSRDTSGGGGGMLGGNGGSVTAGGTLQGGGGGGGLGATGANSSGNTGQSGLLLQSVQGGGAGGSGSSPGGNGGNFGGGGGSGGLGLAITLTPGGGGGGGGKGGTQGQNATPAVAPIGGNGGDFGGGGGGSADLVNGNVGNGGAGGFGGGGGGGNTGGTSNFGGGTGGINGNQGNGGSAYGGALFVRQGGQLTVKTLNTATQFQNSAVTAGSGTVNGNASGSDLYVHTNTTGVFDVATTANSQTLSGTIAGAGGIQKTGAGELILQGVNTYTGATTVTQGTLTLELVGGLPAASAVTNNSTVKFSVAAGGTYSGNMSGTGRLVKEGGGTLTLDGANTFTGGVLISSGTLSLNKDLNAALPITSAVQVNGQLNLLGAYNYQLADITGSGVIDLGGSQFTLGTSTSTTYSGTITTASTGSLVKTGSGTFSMTGNGASTLSSGGLQIAEGKFFIGGSGSFTIAVGGNVTFTGDNTTLEMGGGSLVLSSQSIIGTGQNNTTLEVTDDFTAANMSITNVDNILNTGGAFTINGGVNVTGFSNFTVSGSGNTVINQDLTIDATKAITIDGNSASFDMNAGELTNNGTLNVKNGATLLTSGAQTLKNNNLLNLTGAAITAPIDGSAGLDSALVVNGTVTTGSNITDVHYISVDSGTFTIQNDITGFTAGGSRGSIGFSIADGAIVVLDGVDLDMSGSVVDVSGTLTMDPAQSITGDGNSDLDLRSAFTATGNITNLGDINVRNSGVMTVDISPTNFDRITIDDGGIMVLNTALTINKVGGSLTNSGVLNLQDNNIVGALNSTLTLQSDFETGNGLITGVHNIVVNDANATFTIDTAPVGFTTFNNTAGTVLLNTDFPVVGNLSNAGTFSMNGHNLVVSDGVSLTNTGTWSTNGTITKAANGYDITIGNGGVFTVNNTVSGYTGFTVNNGGQVVMNTGGQLADVVLNANGTLNYSAGDITGNITGTGIVNINGSFVQQGTIQAAEVNVNNGGTLTLNTQIDGALTNSGTLVHTTLGNAVVNGNFTQEAGGLLQLAISDSTLGKTSTIQVYNQTTLNGGAVEITLPDGGQSISDGEVFVLINNTALAANPVLPTVSVPSQLFFGFTPSINGNNLVVTAERKTFSQVNTNPVLAGVAGALDEISTLGQTDTSLLSRFPVIGIIGGQPALQNIESIYNQLIPDEVNGGILESSFLTQNLVVEKLIGRLDQVRYGFNEHRSGYVAGDDIIEGQSSYGPMIFGNLSRQNGRGGLSGYESNTAGFGVFRDAPVTDYFRLGVAVSYAMTRVQRLDFTLNVTDIQNVQGMVYGSLDYRNLFINGVVSMGYNYYRGRRNIEAINQVAMSRYRSSQYGTKIEGGFSIPILNVEVSPTASIQFAHVNRATYQETGAPGANLEVTSQGSSMTELGLGGKIVNVSEPDDFLPEFHVFYLQDLQNSDLRVTSRFVDGGSLFTSQAPKLPKRGINMGLKVSAFISESALLEMGYDLYLRKGFTSQSANLKFRWLF